MNEPAQEIPDPPPEVPGENAPPAAAAPPEGGNRVTELEAQVAVLKDQGLRYLAEMENTRRRAQKEREDASKYAVASFAKDLLAVADNFERALASSLPDGLPDAVRNLLTGVEATGRQLAGALERAGIYKIEPLGQPFDPNLHRVMMEVDDPEKPAGTVIQVLQPGYMIHDRLLREALVAVSKGGSAPKVNTTA